MSDETAALRRICVFCGSSPGAHPAYVEAARRLGGELVARGLGLVYGGARIGLMGAVADAVLAGGGEVHGVIPKILVDKEVAHEGLTALHVVDSMHARKALMADLADGFIALPGGAGTLEELFEIFTWAQLGVHRKPCAVLDVDGYYRPLLAFLDRAVTERFLRPIHREILLAGDSRTPGALLDQMAAYQPPDVDKLLDRGQT